MDNVTLKAVGGADTLLGGAEAFLSHATPDGH
jgi:hypothetical protein